MEHARRFPAKTVLRIGSVLLALMLVASYVRISASAAQGPDSVGDDEARAALYGPVLDEQRAEIIDATDGTLSTYVIEAELVPDETNVIAGTVDVRFVNSTGSEQDSVFLRLYANDPTYDPFGIDLGDITSDGEPVTTEYSVEDTVVEVELDEPLAVGAAVSYTIPFTTTVPGPGQGYGMFGATANGDALSLAHWYPIIAGYDADGQWNLDPPSAIGDPIFSNTALYDVTFTAPDAFEVVTTGSEMLKQRVDDGRTVRHFVTGPVRDFMMVIDDDFEEVNDVVGGTTVRSWFDPEDRDAGERVLDYAVQSLALFNELIGPYPYEELDIVEVPVGGGAAGVEFPQLVLIAASLYDRADTPGVPTFLENVVAHEVVHQWFYALVGNNQYVDAYIDEGLTNYLSTDVYFSTIYSPEVGKQQVDFYLTVPYLTVLFEAGDEVVEQPTDDFSTTDYGVMVYGKAALGFGAIRSEIGDDAFFAALQAYYQQHRFLVAEPADLLAAFEDAADEDLGDLWRHWFRAAEGEQDFDEDDLYGVSTFPVA